MEIRKGNKDGPPASLEEAERLVAERLAAEKQAWLAELCEHPERFGDIERAVHERFGHLADELTAALLAEASQSETYQARKKKSWLRRLIRCGGRRGGR